MNGLIIPQNEKQPRSFGFIYVLANASMPDVYKVGMTTRSPNARAFEVSNATGVPTPFDVVYYAEVAEPMMQEKRVHKLLADYRVNNGREFFKAHLWTIIQAIQAPDTHFTSDEPPIYSEWSSYPLEAIEKSAQILSAMPMEGMQ